MALTETVTSPTSRFHPSGRGPEVGLGRPCSQGDKGVERCS